MKTMIPTRPAAMLRTLVLAILLVWTYGTDDSTAGLSTLKLGDPAPVFAAWRIGDEEAHLSRRLRTFLDNNDPYGIYDLQLNTQEQLIWLHHVPPSPQKSAMVDSLVRLYALPLNYQATGFDARHQPVNGWICGTPQVRQYEIECRDVAGQESYLYSVQFLYGAAKLLRVIADTPASQRSPAQTTFVSQMSPVLVSHMDRWFTECSTGTATRRSPWRCLNPASKAITDKFMQFTAIISEMTTAAPSLPPLAAALARTTAGSAGYRQFMTAEVMPELLARIKLYPSASPGWDRAVFDSEWSIDSEIDKSGVNRSANHCAFYTAATPAARATDCAAPMAPDGGAVTTTMDTSHYVRCVFLFETLMQDAEPSIRDEAYRIATMLARHFTERVIVTRTPWLLANYFGDSAGGAPQGWNRLFFDKSGTPLPPCQTLTTQAEIWQNCEPYAPYPPGSFSNRIAYFLWAPLLPELKLAANDYFRQFPAVTSRDLAVASLAQSTACADNTKCPAQD